ncbi:MAG: response regulator transcription factor [Phaeodactylibacter sp.]|nr:response regulator transcription factor [Phaeodactylibacter sp.]
MKVLILEDEELAAERLSNLIRQYDKDIELLGILDSVEDAVKWFQKNPAPSLAFFDIQLADARSFQVFEQCEVRCPVIFTTAYDQYALQAFKVNSIDYLLKPIGLEDLSQAFRQYESLRNTFTAANRGLEQIQQAFQMMARPYKSRFIIRSSHQFFSVRVEDILYFFSEHKMVWAKHRNDKKHAVDYTLEQLEEILDPSRFFRVNRQFVVAFDAVEEAVIYSNSRLKLRLKGLPDDEEILVSRERVKDFKEWMDQ